MSIETRILIAGLLFAVKFAAGFWLTRSGRPYNVALLAIHKTISLVFVAWIGIAIFRLRRDAGLTSAQVAALIITSLLFVLVIASGGLVSADKPANRAILIAHQVLPFLTVLSTAGTLYLVVW